MFCTYEGCTKEALYSFTWPWGESGASCQLHCTHFQQKAQALGRGALGFVTLDPGRPQEVTRDERTRLLALNITAEEDLKAAQARCAVLYAENTLAREQARVLKFRLLEVEKQIVERQADIDKLAAERDAARADAGEAQQEVAELQAMLPRAPAEFPPLEGMPNVVG